MKRIGELNAELTERPYIYRIETLDRFYEILTHKRLTLVRPALWSDPLENIIFNATLIKNQQPYQHPAAQRIYGQCWSYEADSYALWQIYTTKFENQRLARYPGVRMVTSLDRLTHLSDRNPGDYYYGLVSYKWKKQLRELAKDPDFIQGLRMEDISLPHIRTLLVKRKSYTYENEVRLLAVPDPSLIDPDNPQLCRLRIEPLEFITSVRFDPTMDPKEFKYHKQRLVTEFGFRPTQVTLTSLNQANKFRFNLDK